MAFAERNFVRDLSQTPRENDVVLGDDWVAPDKAGPDEMRVRRERRGLFSLRMSSFSSNPGFSGPQPSILPCCYGVHVLRAPLFLWLRFGDLLCPRAGTLSLSMVLDK